MSQENVELARRMVEWFNAADADAVQAHSTDDVEIVPLRAEIEDTVYRGPRAAAAFAADSDESWEKLRFDAEALRDAGDRVVAIGRLSARARGTGAEVSARLALLFEFRGDQISKAQSYADVEGALKAAGLRE
ncbi:MAG: SnoaL-like domain [Gaiellaceae bacterium]|jgi:ketosteroid isomerase-like protein|nr:SnoaL-like domain [Gaiellaceae bacterium]